MEEHEKRKPALIEKMNNKVVNGKSASIDLSTM